MFLKVVLEHIILPYVAEIAVVVVSVMLCVLVSPQLLPGEIGLDRAEATAPHFLYGNIAGSLLTFTL